MVRLKNTKRTIESPLGALISPVSLAPLGAFVVREENSWEEYEQLKNSLPSNLSPQQYQDAIFEICEKLSL